MIMPSQVDTNKSIDNTVLILEQEIRTLKTTIQVMHDEMVGMGFSKNKAIQETKLEGANEIKALKGIAGTTTEPKYREHVTTWFHDNPAALIQSRVPAPTYLINKSHRLTVDTRSDMILMEKIFDAFYTPKSPLPNLEKVIQFLDTRPDIAQLNSDTHQKNWRS